MFLFSKCKNSLAWCIFSRKVNKDIYQKSTYTGMTHLYFMKTLYSFKLLNFYKWGLKNVKNVTENRHSCLCSIHYALVHRSRLIFNHKDPFKSTRKIVEVVRHSPLYAPVRVPVQLMKKKLLSNDFFLKCYFYKYLFLFFKTF